MNFRTMTTEQIAMILHGLRSVYVQDSEEVRAKLIADCEAALSARGFCLVDEMAKAG